jgi:hypothetical protein
MLMRLGNMICAQGKSQHSNKLCRAGQGRAGGEQGMEVALQDDNIHKAQLLEKRQVKCATVIVLILENTATESGDTKGGQEAVYS